MRINTPKGSVCSSANFLLIWTVKNDDDFCCASDDLFHLNWSSEAKAWVWHMVYSYLWSRQEQLLLQGGELGCRFWAHRDVTCFLRGHERTFWCALQLSSVNWFGFVNKLFLACIWIFHELSVYFIKLLRQYYFYQFCFCSQNKVNNWFFYFFLSKLIV